MAEQRPEGRATGAHEHIVSDDFTSFVVRERASLLGVAFALCADRHAAEDLVQDALVEAFRRWDRVGTYDEPGAWARRVVVNRATSRWRRLGTESRALARFGARPVAPGTERDPDADRFWDGVRALPRRQSQMIALRYADDLEIAEIATVMECAEGTVKATLHHARRALAQKLALEVRDDA